MTTCFRTCCTALLFLPLMLCAHIPPRSSHSLKAESRVAKSTVVLKKTTQLNLENNQFREKWSAKSPDLKVGHEIRQDLNLMKHIFMPMSSNNLSSSSHLYLNKQSKLSRKNFYSDTFSNTKKIINLSEVINDNENRSLKNFGQNFLQRLNNNIDNTTEIPLHSKFNYFKLWSNAQKRKYKTSTTSLNKIFDAESSSKRTTSTSLLKGTTRSKRTVGEHLTLHDIEQEYGHKTNSSKRVTSWKSNNTIPSLNITTSLKLLYMNLGGKYLCIYQGGRIKGIAKSKVDEYCVIRLLSPSLKDGVTLKFKGKKSQLFLALGKGGRVYATSNASDKNTEFLHQFELRHYDAFLSKQQQSFLSFRFNGRPYHSSITEVEDKRAHFYIHSLSTVSKDQIESKKPLKDNEGDSRSGNSLPVSTTVPTTTTNGNLNNRGESSDEGSKSSASKGKGRKRCRSNKSKRRKCSCRRKRKNGRKPKCCRKKYRNTARCLKRRQNCLKKRCSKKRKVKRSVNLEDIEEDINSIKTFPHHEVSRRKRVPKFHKLIKNRTKQNRKFSNILSFDRTKYPT